MEQYYIFFSLFMLKLPDGFQKRLALNIAYRPPTSMMAILSSSSELSR